MLRTYHKTLKNTCGGKGKVRAVPLLFVHFEERVVDGLLSVDGLQKMCDSSDSPKSFIPSNFLRP